MLLGRLPKVLTIDDKGRLVIPALLRKEIEKEGGGQDLHLGCLEKGYLYLHTEKQHREFVDALSEVLDNTRKSRETRRKILYRFVPVSLDSAGRILVPKDLKEAAGIERDVIILFMNERIEIMPADKAVDLAEDDESFDDALEDVFAEIGARPRARGSDQGNE